MCEGAVIKELKTKVRICENGKLKYRKKTEVKPDYPDIDGDGDKKESMAQAAKDKKNT